MVKNTLAARPSNREIKALAEQQINARLNEFKGLEENWDGDSADMVLNSTIGLAKKVAYYLIDCGVKIDFCVPMRNGGVQFEFKMSQDCEVEVHPNEEIFFLTYDDSVNLTSKLKMTLEQLKKQACLLKTM